MIKIQLVHFYLLFKAEGEKNIRIVLPYLHSFLVHLLNKQALWFRLLQIGNFSALTILLKNILQDPQTIAPYSL